MEYNPPFGSNDPSAPYVDENTPGAISGSRVPGPAIELPQREIVEVIEFFLDDAPSNADKQQLRKAIQKAISDAIAGVSSGGTTDTQVPQATLAELQAGSNVNKYSPPDHLRTELNKKLDLTGGNVSGDLNLDGHLAVKNPNSSQQASFGQGRDDSNFIAFFRGLERKGFLQVTTTGVQLAGQNGNDLTYFRLSGTAGASLTKPLNVTGHIATTGHLQTTDGNIFLNATPGNDSRLYFRDENNINMGLAAWDRSANTMYLHLYAQNGNPAVSFTVRHDGVSHAGVDLVKENRSINAGLGISGGGQLTGDVSLSLSLNELPAVTTLSDPHHVVVNVGAATQNVPRQISLANLRTALNQNPAFNAVGHEGVYTNNGLSYAGDTVSGQFLTIPNATGVWQLRSLARHEQPTPGTNVTRGIWRKIA